MLQSLHVKNLALIEETEVEFGRGLNILTGETGAGKSLLLGSINLALGAKFDKEMLRKDAESALVELQFSIEDERVRRKLEQMELDTDCESIIISRKMQVGKSVCKINGEMVTAKQVKELAEELLDIHGQHEHQSLLKKAKHLEILDEFGGIECAEMKASVAGCYAVWKDLQEQLQASRMDDATKSREQALAEFECDEIAEANLVAGEEEVLEERYRKMVNSKKICESLSESYHYTGNDTEQGAGASVSRALRALRGVASYDCELADMEAQLSEIENLLNDFQRDMAAYMEESQFDREDFEMVEDRLNLIHRLQDKYGSTIEDIYNYYEDRLAFLDRMSDYDAYMEDLGCRLKEAEAKLLIQCAELSTLRQKNAAKLETLLIGALEQLNFLTVQFKIDIQANQAPAKNGYDDVEFLISTNPGEGLKPLHRVASGGELSRIMLGIKTVLAGKDAIDTLVFDEIDAGISGKTAWKVAEQLDVVGKNHQVICITHLPQIASMADCHFAIEKRQTADHTSTNIRLLQAQESLGEVARLLGSDALTEEAISNAKAMRKQALDYKKSKSC